jgi:hypothetical protein
MNGSEREPHGLPENGEHLQEADGIRTAGNPGKDRLSGADHGISFNDGADPALKLLHVLHLCITG